jgi:hypothetical protein
MEKKGNQINEKNKIEKVKNKPTTTYKYRWINREMDR